MMDFGVRGRINSSFAKYVSYGNKRNAYYQIVVAVEVRAEGLKLGQETSEENRYNDMEDRVVVEVARNREGSLTQAKLNFRRPGTVPSSCLQEQNELGSNWTVL